MIRNSLYNSYLPEAQKGRKQKEIKEGIYKMPLISGRHVFYYDSKQKQWYRKDTNPNAEIVDWQKVPNIGGLIDGKKGLNYYASVKNKKGNSPYLLQESAPENFKPIEDKGLTATDLGTGKGVTVPVSEIANIIPSRNKLFFDNLEKEEQNLKYNNQELPYQNIELPEPPSYISNEPEIRPENFLDLGDNNYVYKDGDKWYSVNSRNRIYDPKATEQFNKLFDIQNKQLAKPITSTSNNTGSVVSANKEDNKWKGVLETLTPEEALVKDIKESIPVQTSTTPSSSSPVTSKPEFKLPEGVPSIEEGDKVIKTKPDDVYTYKLGKDGKWKWHNKDPKFKDKGWQDLNPAGVTVIENEIYVDPKDKTKGYKDKYKEQVEESYVIPTGNLKLEDKKEEVKLEVEPEVVSTKKVETKKDNTNTNVQTTPIKEVVIRKPMPGGFGISPLSFIFDGSRNTLYSDEDYQPYNEREIKRQQRQERIAKKQEAQLENINENNLSSNMIYNTNQNTLSKEIDGGYLTDDDFDVIEVDTRDLINYLKGGKLPKAQNSLDMLKLNNPPTVGEYLGFTYPSVDTKSNFNTDFTFKRKEPTDYFKSDKSLTDFISKRKPIIPNNNSIEFNTTEPEKVNYRTEYQKDPWKIYEPSNIIQAKSDYIPGLYNTLTLGQPLDYARALYTPPPVKSYAMDYNLNPLQQAYNRAATEIRGQASGGSGYLARLQNLALQTGSKEAEYLDKIRSYNLADRKRQDEERVKIQDSMDKAYMLTDASARQARGTRELIRKELFKNEMDRQKNFAKLLSQETQDTIAVENYLNNLSNDYKYRKVPGGNWEIVHLPSNTKQTVASDDLGTIIEKNRAKEREEWQKKVDDKEKTIAELEAKSKNQNAGAKATGAAGISQLATKTSKFGGWIKENEPYKKRRNRLYY